MKRIIFGSAVLLWALALIAGCAQMPQTSAAQPAAPAIERIQQQGELVVGTAGNMPPLNMTTKGGQIIGFEADLARYMATAMGVELRFETLPFSELLPALESGKVNMVLSGVTMTPRRNLKAAFVGPYYTSGKCFLTKVKDIASAEEASEANRPDITLAALQGSTSQVFAEKNISKAKLMLVRDYDEGVRLVLDNKVDALVADYPICIVSLVRHPEEELVSLITRLTYEPIGVAMPANDPLLVNWVENLLLGLEGSGRLADLEARWFKDGAWLDKLK